MLNSHVSTDLATKLRQSCISVQKKVGSNWNCTTFMCQSIIDSVDFIHYVNHLTVLKPNQHSNNSFRQQSACSRQNTKSVRIQTCSANFHAFHTKSKEEQFMSSSHDLLITAVQNINKMFFPTILLRASINSNRDVVNKIALTVHIIKCRHQFSRNYSSQWLDTCASNNYRFTVIMKACTQACSKQCFTSGHQVGTQSDECKFRNIPVVPLRGVLDVLDVFLHSFFLYSFIYHRQI